MRGWAGECQESRGLGASVDTNQNGWVLCWITEWVGGQAWTGMWARVAGGS